MELQRFLYLYQKIWHKKNYKPCPGSSGKKHFFQKMIEPSEIRRQCIYCGLISRGGYFTHSTFSTSRRQFDRSILTSTTEYVTDHCRIKFYGQQQEKENGTSGLPNKSKLPRKKYGRKNNK